MADAVVRRPLLVRDTAWLTSADVLTIIGGLLGQVMLTHALSQEKYGLFIVLIDAFALIFMLIDAGLPTIITRDVPGDRGLARGLVSRTLRIQAVLACCFLPIGLVVGFLIWSDIPILLLLFCSSIPLVHIFTYAHRSVLRALGEARQEAIVKVLERLVVTSGYGILLLMGVNDPTWYAGAFLSGAVVSLLYALWQGERMISSVIENPSPIGPTRDLIISALPFAVTLGILPLLGRMEKVLLASWYGYSSAALYHVAFLAYLAGLTLPQAIRAAFLPILGDSRGDTARTASAVAEARKLVNLLIPIGMILGAVIAWFLMPLAFPVEYNDGSMGWSTFELFLLLLSGWGLTMLAAPTYVEVCAGQRPWLFTRMLAESAAVAVVTALFVIPRFGVLGAVISSITAALALLFSSLYHSQTGSGEDRGLILTSLMIVCAAPVIALFGLQSGSTPLVLLAGSICFAPWLVQRPNIRMPGEEE